MSMIITNAGSLPTRTDRTTADIVTGGTTALFTIATGRILLWGFVGEVTTAIGAGATTLKFQSNPTTGTTTDLCATLDIDADAGGTLYTMTGAIATALQRSEHGGLIDSLWGNPFVIPIGAIESVSGADRAGSIKLSVWWTPLDDGATLVAA